MDWPGRSSLVVGYLEGGQQAGVVVGPGAQERRCGCLCDRGGDLGALKEIRAVREQNPSGAVRSSQVVPGTFDQLRLHVGGDGELCDLRREVEVLVGDMEGNDTTRREVFFVQCYGLGGEQMQ